MAEKEIKKKSWVRYKPAEVEKLVVKEAKHGHKPSVIGMIMRDTYGIPDVEKTAGKKITKILDENKVSLELPEDIYFMIKKALNLREHLEKNRKDVPSIRSRDQTEARIRNLTKYYIKEKKLPKKWVYDPEKIKILIH